MLKPSTIARRIERGMTPEEAATKPVQIHAPKKNKLNMAQVMEVEAHGLSLCNSAYLLRVTAPTLGKFVRKHGIEWRGKRHCYRFGCDSQSDHQKILKSGLPIATIYWRIRNGMSIDDAIVLGRSRRLKITDEQIVECEKLGLNLEDSAKLLKVSKQGLWTRVRKMGIEWRGKKNTGAKQQ